MNQTYFHNLKSTVIDNNYCIGCGACEFINSDKYKIKLTSKGMYNAHVVDESIVTGLNAEKVCPFSNNSMNEDEISRQLYNDIDNHDHRIGKYIKCYAGHVSEGAFRENGSSGGFGKWLLTELLNSDKVDYVIQVEPNKTKNKLFTYSIFQKGDDLLRGAKSAYYPITMVDALNFIKNNKGRYAITALPCFSKALRLLSTYDDELKSRIKVVLGVICGHLKSTGFAESLAWQIGVTPEKLVDIEFRGKLSGKKANEKGVQGFNIDGSASEMVSSRSLVGGNWGHGLFKYKACDYCDDIVGETTDVSIGDAWLDEYVDDYKGANIVIVRSKLIYGIIERAIKSGRLALDSISKEKVIESQAGGIRHRREGLSYRLYLKRNSGDWVPPKRVKPQRLESPKRREIYKLREKLRDESHEKFLAAKESGDLKKFLDEMNSLIYKYEAIYRPWWKSKIKSLLTKVGLLKYFQK